MQAPDLRERRRKLATASSSATTPSSTKDMPSTVSPKSPKVSKAKPVSPSASPSKQKEAVPRRATATTSSATSGAPKTATVPAAVTRRARLPVEPLPTAQTAGSKANVTSAHANSTAGRGPDTSASRASAVSEDSGSFVTVSPMTTPGNSYVPLHRRKLEAEMDPASDAATTAPHTQGSTRPVSGPQLHRTNSRTGAPGQSSTPPTATATKSVGSSGIPISRGQLASPRGGPQTQAHLPLQRQGSGFSAVNTRTGAKISPTETPLSRPAQPSGVPVTRPSLGMNYYDQLEQMEAVMDYVDSITQALAHRTRSLPPPEALNTFRATILPSGRRAGGSSATGAPGSGRGFSSLADEDAHYSLLSNLHDASSMLLSAFSKLEYVNLSEKEPLQDLERATLQSCARVLAVVEKVDRKFTTHEDADLRIAFKQRRNAVIACQEFVDSLTQTAQQIVLLRKLTAAHEYYRVREIYDELKEVMERRVVTAASPLSASYQELMLTGPFFEWLDQRWLPAMRAWRKVVLDARQTASAGDTEGAIATSQQELLSVPSLQVILRPGETLTDLHHSEIEVPIAELAKTFEQKQAVMDALDRAMEAPSQETLVKAIQSTHAFTQVRSRTQQLTDEDEERVKSAEQLLADMQAVDVVQSAMESALRSGSGATSLTLFHPLQRANELILRLGIAQSTVHADRVVRASKAALSRLAALVPGYSADETALAERRDTSSYHATVDATSISSTHTTLHLQPILSELLPASVTPQDLCIPHVPSSLWRVEVSATYQELCQQIAQVAMRETVRRDLEKAVAGDMRSGAGGATSVSAIAATTATPTAVGLTNSSLPDSFSPNTTCRDEDDDESGSNGRRTTLTATSCATSPRAGSSATAMLTAMAELDELQTRVRRAEELGLSGALVDQAKARIAQLSTIRLKVHFDAQARIIPVTDPDNTSFDKIYERLLNDCVEQQQHLAQRAVGDQRLRIRYEDLDGDFITILNDDDWQMMLSERAPRGHRAGVKIEIYCDFQLLPNSARASTTADGGAPCQPGVDGQPTSLARTNSAAHAVTANASGAPVRQGRAGGAGGRIRPALNKAAALRAASRQRHVSPALTVENLTRSQSGYAQQAAAAVSGNKGGGTLGAAKTQRGRAKAAKAPAPALVQEWDHAVTSERVSGEKGVLSETPVACVTPPVEVVKLDLETGKRWDDDASRLSLLELQTTASLSTVPASRVTAPAGNGDAGNGRSVLESANAAAAASRNLANRSPRPAGASTRFTATNCSKASPVKALPQTSPSSTPQKASAPPPPPPPPPPQPVSFSNAKHWYGDDDGDASGDGIFDDIHTVYSDATRVRDSRGRETTYSALDASEKENACVSSSPSKMQQQQQRRGRSPCGNTSGRPLALPPRPDPHRRTGTPTRPRAQRGAASPLTLDEAAAHHRDASDLLGEMEQLQQQNQRAMRTPTPRRVWH